MTGRDVGAKAAVALGAMAFVLTQAGAVSGPMVQTPVLAGAIIVGSFLALLASDAA